MTSSKRVKQAAPKSVDPGDLEKLVLQAQAGDQDAFSSLIEATQNRLFRFCVYLCGDRTLAEDICQETLLRAFSRLSSLTKTQSFLDWTAKFGPRRPTKSVPFRPVISVRWRPGKSDQSARPAA